jgi:hypothetical protein
MCGVFFMFIFNANLSRNHNSMVCRVVVVLNSRV